METQLMKWEIYIQDLFFLFSIIYFVLLFVPS